MALVIGNSAYQNTPTLINPKNDAQDISALLTSLGFRVILGLDLDKAGMDRKISEFAEALVRADAGVFFYGGHGLQIGGQNYLIPTDARLQTARSLDFEAVRLDLLQRAMERSVKTSIIFLDACRDNPLARNLARAMGTRNAEVSRGLAAVSSGVGTLISFSTQPGSVALDGDGRNSPFATALLKHLAAPEPITDVLITVRNDVVAATNQQQVPWEHSALRARFYFKEPGNETPVALPAPSEGPRSEYEQKAELALWKSVKDSRNPAMLQSFIDQFPDGRFAETARIMVGLLNKEREQTAAADRSKVEAQQADEAKKAALAQEQEAKRKADDAKRQADYQAALEEARKAREVAEQAEARRVSAERDAEAARKAAQAADAARAQQASGAASDSGAPLAVAALPSADSAKRGIPDASEALASDVQKQLKRVGCYTGAIDGKWGEGTKAALDTFANETKMTLSSDEPTQEALNILSASKDGICKEAKKSTTKKAEKSSGKRRQSRTSSSSGGSEKSSGSGGTVIFGVGKGVGIGIGF